MSREKILQLIRIRGPIVPSQLVKDIGKESYIVSAMLSELVANDALIVSSLKFGGSPLYYIPGQESKLQQFSDKLNEKERRAYSLLKEKKVLQDKALDPVTRVALRSLKDFAFPLSVTSNGATELFWKWYLVSDAEASELIKQELGLVPPPAEPQPVPVQLPQPAPVREKVAASEAASRPVEERPRRVERLEAPQQVRSKPAEVKRPEPAVIEKKPESRIEKPRKERAPEQRPLPVAVETPALEYEEDIQDAFLDEVQSFFKSKNIIMIKKEVVKKNSELDLIVEIPVSVGRLTYYCKCKKKKKVSDSDLSSAYVQSQFRKLPVLFVTNGDLTKRATEMLGKEFKSITFVKMGPTSV
jgi:hypothetical protein